VRASHLLLYDFLLHLTLSYPVLFHSTPFYLILPCPTSFYLVLLHSTLSYCVLPRLTASYLVSLHSTLPYCALLHPTSFHLVLLRSTSFYFVLPRSTSFYLVLPRFSSFYLILLHYTPSTLYIYIPPQYSHLSHLVGACHILQLSPASAHHQHSSPQFRCIRQSVLPLEKVLKFQFLCIPCLVELSKPEPLLILELEECLLTKNSRNIMGCP